MKDYAALDRDAAQFEKRFPKSPLRNDVRRMLARSLVERKEYARAVALLESLIAAVPAGHIGQRNTWKTATSRPWVTRGSSVTKTPWRRCCRWWTMPRAS